MRVRDVRLAKRCNRSRASRGSINREKHPGELYAIDNRCTHQNAELTGGRIRSGYISCPLHGVRFNLQTGEPMGQLTRLPVRTHMIRIEDGRILLQRPDTPS